MDLKLQEQTRKMNWGQEVWFTMKKSGGADVQGSVRYEHKMDG